MSDKHLWMEEGIYVFFIFQVDFFFLENLRIAKENSFVALLVVKVLHDVFKI